MKVKHSEAGETPTLTPEEFRETPEFRDFKGIVRKLLAVPKPELDRMVVQAKKESPRAGNPASPGRKSRATRNT